MSTYGVYVIAVNDLIGKSLLKQTGQSAPETDALIRLSPWARARMLSSSMCDEGACGGESRRRRSEAEPCESARGGEERAMRGRAACGTGAFLFSFR